MSAKETWKLGSTRTFYFNTRTAAQAPVAMAGAALTVDAYVNGSVTQIAAGGWATATEGLDGVVGFNCVQVVLTAANGFTANTDVAFVVSSATTVDGVSILGVVLQEVRVVPAGADGVLCIGTVKAGGAVGAFVIESVVEGALVNCGASNLVHIAGVGTREVKTFGVAEAGAVTCDNLPADPSGLVAIVYVGAPADALDDLTTTQKASVVTAAGTANTTYDAATGTEIAALDAVVDTVKVDTAAILVDTGTTLDGRIPAALTAGGKIKASLNEVLETALPAESVAGRDAAALGKLLDVATPVLTAASVNQTTDNPTANAVADALLDRADAIETGITPRGALRIVVADAAGQVTDAATAAPLIKNPAGTKTRITDSGVDADGNRGAPTLDLT